MSFLYEVAATWFSACGLVPDPFEELWQTSPTEKATIPFAVFTTENENEKYRTQRGVYYVASAKIDVIARTTEAADELADSVKMGRSRKAT